MKKNNSQFSTLNFQLRIGWLYPDLMNTYGDRGNIIVLKKRCEWRGIETKIIDLNPGFDHKLLATCNMLFMGGAQDKQQKIVSDDFTKEKIRTLKEAVEDEIPGLYICGAYQFLGKYYKEADGTVIPGLGILDLFTENPGKERLIGNIAVKSTMLSFDFAQDDNDKVIVGFENHGGRTYLGSRLEPLGKVLKGFGNNGDQPRLDGGQAGDKNEGCVYKNSFGTYLHGPILPKNPHFADLLINLALEKKYKSPIALSPLDDSLEWQAHNLIAKRLKVKL